MADALSNNNILNILQSSPTTYPNYTQAVGASDDQIAAWAYICSQIGVDPTNYVAMFSTTSTYLTNYQSRVSALTYLSSESIQFSENDFNSLKNDLLFHLNNAFLVTAYFEGLIDIYNAVFMVNSVVMGDIKTSCDVIENSPGEVKGLMSDILMGLCETGEGMIPGADILQGLVATAGNAYVDSQDILGGAKLENNFVATVDNLETILFDKFKLLKSKIIKIKGMLIADPSMAQKFAALTGLERTAAAPYWTDESKEAMIEAINDLYIDEIINLLLPINFCIYYAYVSSDVYPQKGYYVDTIQGNVSENYNRVGFDSETLNFLSNVPRLHVPHNYNNYVNSSNCPGKNKVYWLAKKQDPMSELDGAFLFERLNGLAEFFLGQNNWKVDLVYFGWPSAFTVRVCNNSSYLITLQPHLYMASDFGLFIQAYDDYQKSFVQMLQAKSDAMLTRGVDNNSTILQIPLQPNTVADFQGVQTSQSTKDEPFSLYIGYNPLAGINKDLGFHIIQPPAIPFYSRTMSTTLETGVYGKLFINVSINNPVAMGGDAGGGCTIYISDAAIGQQPVITNW